MTTMETRTARCRDLGEHDHDATCYEPVELKGLTATVYYNARYRGCSAGGIAERCESVTIVGMRFPGTNRPEIQPLPKGCRVFKPSEEAPAVVLVYRIMGGRELVHAEPAEPCPADHVGYMSGGSYIGSSDSRFGELVGFYGAISFHDRSETQAQYNALST